MKDHILLPSHLSSFYDMDFPLDLRNNDILFLDVPCWGGLVGGIKRVSVPVGQGKQQTSGFSAFPGFTV